MQLRILTEKHFEEIEKCTTALEAIALTKQKKEEASEFLNKNGHDINLNEDNIASNPRHLNNHEEINKYYFLLDLDKIQKGLQGRFFDDLSERHFSDEINKRVKSLNFI